MISAPSLERLLRRLLRAARRAAVVLHQKLDVGIVEFGERHLGGVAHRQRGARRHCRCADSGRISATFTWPAPIALGCAGGGGGGADEPKPK